MEIKNTLMSKDGNRIAQMTIILASGAEVIIDDSCFEEDADEAVLIKSKPGETSFSGTGDVDLSVTLMESEITDIVQPNADARRRSILRNISKN